MERIGYDQGTAHPQTMEASDETNDQGSKEIVHDVILSVVKTG